jgi:uncharacterized membrane-anchored protein
MPCVAFWIIKILATTVGETGADYLNFNVGLGLALTAVLMTSLLAVLLVVQLRQKRYLPWIYWLVVVFLSIVGTLITDIMTDSLGVSLYLSSAIFFAALVGTFLAWHHKEGTLSIHAIDTPSREAFYWAAILFTFALGTAAGDLLSEQLGMGYAKSGLIFAGGIALVTLGYYMRMLGSVAVFWIAYILTRPLGASIGDFLTQLPKAGGLGLSAMTVSGVFLVLIVTLVGYLSVTGRDQIQMPPRLRCDA